ncbi:hypothetical protein HD806DRAFT_552733 [Xylariaceae sp. AK1471]|nr:hypothetical protein HD806DRAFT_552733 [Xylariaceae sp. AK1471]
MTSGQQGQQASSQAANTQEAGNSTGSPNRGNQNTSEQVYDYVSLAELELFPSPPSLSSCYFVLPDFTFQTPDTNKTEQSIQNASPPTQAQAQANTSFTQATRAANPGQTASLDSLWWEAGADLRNVTPTRDEHEVYQVDPARDGLTSMITGPSCSVCGAPMTYERLISGEPCKMCHFI